MNIPVVSRKKKPLSAREARLSLIRKESEHIGSKIFGPVPLGRTREFYCLDEHTWVWHETWTENGKQRSQTVKYVIYPNEITKTINGTRKKVDDHELSNLRHAMRAYYKGVMKGIYNIDPATGQKIRNP